MPFSASGGLPLGTKGKLLSTWVDSIMLHGSETWPVKEEDVVTLERSDARTY